MRPAPERGPLGEQSSARGLAFPLAFGAGGAAVLIALGIWQLDRLGWKEGLIAEAEARLAADPRPLPAAPDPATDDWTRVRVEGRIKGDGETYVLTSQKLLGPGYRIVVPFETDGGRRILLDRGFVPEAERDPATREPVPERMAVTGVLRWPNETGAFTPDPVPERSEWYARDVARMAAALGTEPLLVVAEPHGGRKHPRGTQPKVTLPNNHFGYAMTWFSLAAIWLAMTAALVWRVRRGEA